MKFKSSKTTWIVATFFSFCFMLVSCVNSNDSTTENSEDEDSVAVEINWGDSTELDLIVSLFQQEVSIEELETFLDSGGDFNKFGEYSSSYEYDRLGSNIPIVKDFMGSTTTSGTDFYQISPLQALLINEQPKKMKLLSFMLNHGADPNIKSPDGMNALEYFYNRLKDDIIMSQWESEGSFMARDNKSFTFKIIDTLVAHGADIEHSSLFFAGQNAFVMEYAIELGADPKTIHAANFFGGPGVMVDREVIKKLSRHGLDFSTLDGNSLCFYTFDDEELRFLFECGFDPNTEISDGYILDHAIKQNKLYLVECVVEHGGTKVSDDKSPVNFAKSNDASAEIVNFLKTKFP
jgi:hypothetical protein